MLIEIGRAMRCRWVPAATVAVMAGTLGLAGAVPAAASPKSLIDLHWPLHHQQRPGY